MITLTLLLGLCVIAAGVAMIYLPAGIIAGGAGLVLLAIVMSRGMEAEDKSRDISGTPADSKRDEGGRK